MKRRALAELAVRWTILGFTALLFLFFGLYFVVAIGRSLVGLPQDPLVSRGVRSITVREPYRGHIPGLGRGEWQQVDRGDCHTWYYLGPEE